MKFTDDKFYYSMANEPSTEILIMSHCY